MVFGYDTAEYAPPQPEHFAASKLAGTKTACGITVKARRTASIYTWKDPKMVTCQRCRKALGL
jgi:hypothetical protein